MSLEPEPGPEATVIAMAAPPSAQPVGLAASIKSIRLRRGWSQNALGKRMGVPRTYFSKCETGKTVPTLRTLARIAAGLGVSVAELLDSGEQKRADEIRELVSQPFIRSMLPFLPRLTELQRDGLLIQLRQMSLRQRRTA